MYIFTPACTHSYTHTRLHTRAHANSRTHTLTRMRSCIRMRMHMCTRTDTHKSMNARICDHSLFNLVHRPSHSLPLHFGISCMSQQRAVKRGIHPNFHPHLHLPHRTAPSKCSIKSLTRCALAPSFLADCHVATLAVLNQLIVLFFLVLFDCLLKEEPLVSTSPNQMIARRPDGSIGDGWAHLASCKQPLMNCDACKVINRSLITTLAYTHAHHVARVRTI